MPHSADGTRRVPATFQADFPPARHLGYTDIGQFFVANRISRKLHDVSACLTAVSPTIRPWAPWPLRWLASLKLAVILLVVLAVVAAAATFIEVAKGRDYVLWYVYHSPWFIGLLGLLCLNVLAAAIVRFPWKIGQIPFLLTHVGLLVLLAGAVWTFQGGIEGRLVLGEGEAADRIALSDRCQFRVQWAGGAWPAGPLAGRVRLLSRPRRSAGRRGAWTWAKGAAYT